MDEAGQTTILKRDALGRIALPREKREALLDEFERGGLSGTQFARAAGINYQTFAGWVQQRRHGRGDYAPRQHRGATGQPAPAAIRLVEAVVAAPAECKAADTVEGRPETGLRLEVLLPGGAKVLISDAAQVRLVAQLLHALGRPC